MTIECTLSRQSLENAADELLKYAESLKGKTEKFVQSLGEKCAESARSNLIHIDTGNTRDSIQFIQEGTNGIVSVGGAAVWIEFGTGVKKNRSAGTYVHPKAEELGMSAIGTYDKGHGADPNGWWYPYDGGYRHTYGIEYNPFMYKASQEIRREMLNMAKEAYKID